MKHIFKKILILSLVFIIVSIIFADTTAVKISDNKFLKIYDIKEKEEVLVKNSDIFDFYEENHEELEILLEEKRKEEERIAKENRINYKRNVISFAKKFVGNPYVMGGNSLTNGTDCSGFVMLVYANFGISLPRTTTGQALSGVEVPIDDIEIGDIISYGYDGYPSHSAIYIGDNMIVHAGTEQTGIAITSLYIMPIISIRRVA